MRGLGWSASPSAGIIAQQLLELGKLDLSSENNNLCKTLASVVPTIYSRLSDLGSEDIDLMRSILSGSRCVWVGNGFASVDKVAFKVRC